MASERIPPNSNRRHNNHNRIMSRLSNIGKHRENGGGGGGDIGGSRKFILVTSNLILIAFISMIQPTGSVILQPGVYPKSSHPPQPPPSEPLLTGHIKLFGEEPPYALTIDEGSDLEIKTNSRGAITINLNRAVSEDINVTVSIHSGPNLLEFETSNNGSRNFQLREHTKSSINVTYKANTFGDRIIKFRTGSSAGHAEIVCQIAQQPKDITIDDETAYISINVGKSWKIRVLIQIVGWIYFFAWSASFYFQLVLNYQRQSVVGLNFDFMALNLLGFTCYSIYNFTFLFSYDVQREYYKRYAYSRIPVEYNDLFFSLHAFTITLITISQCFFYERAEQKVSLPASIFVGFCTSLGLGLYIAQLFNSLSILDVVLYLSYVKLIITIIKYGPQAFMNYQRKATTGWSIHNILLDFTGGVFSITQMFLLAYNYDDWVSIFGNFTKFGLGVISMSFDIIFVIQHYVLYKQPIENLDDSTESVPSPVISQSIRSTSYVPAAPQQPQAQQPAPQLPPDAGPDQPNHPSDEHRDGNVEFHD